MIGLPIQRIGICVPARDEAASIAGCLRAIGRAAAGVRQPVTVVVVADACSDDTAERARHAAVALGLRVRVLPVRARAVGRARAAGMASLIDELGSQHSWLASTDADSQVPAGWLAGQLRHARAGAELVAGTVTVADWSGHLPALRARVIAEYARRAGHPHGHVHGANLGFTAAGYLAAGGFAPVAAHEDVLLVRTASRLGLPVCWAEDIPVITSARLLARAPDGFAHYLAGQRRLVSSPGHFQGGVSPSFA